MSFLRILREIGHLVKFLCTAKQARQIVFYAEDAPSYTYFEGLVRCLTDKHKVPIAYITSDPTDPIMRSENPLIRAFYFRGLLPFVLLYLKAKYLIMTMPDIGLFHIKRSIFPVNHVYMFHNIGSSFPVIRHGALFNYDTIFCVGPHHIEEIRDQEKLYSLKRKELVQFGYCRLDKMYLEYQQFARTTSKGQPDRPCVLLGPSWGPDSILNRCGSELIQILLDAGLKVIVRPHIMSYRKDSQLIRDLRSRFEVAGNFIFDPDMGYLQTLYESDVLISDWSGLVYEYSFGTEQPVLFIDVPRKIMNPHADELTAKDVDRELRNQLGTILSLGELVKAPEAIDDLLGRRELFVERIRRLRDEYVYNFLNSSQIGADWLLDGLSEERPDD